MLDSSKDSKYKVRHRFCRINLSFNSDLSGCGQEDISTNYSIENLDMIHP